jgi:hypothetical protein
MSVFRRNEPEPSTVSAPPQSPVVCEARVVGRMKIDQSRDLVLDHQQLRGADFSGRKVMGFTSIGSRFEGCRFDKLKIEPFRVTFGAGREMSEYIDCSFDGARFYFTPGGYYRFVRCSFRDVDLRDWFCFAVEVIDCVFSGRLRGGIFNGTLREDERAIIGRERNEFHGNDFSAMKLIDVAFRTGIDLTQQKLPTGLDYVYIEDAAEAVQRARASVIHWDELGRRRLALVEVKILEEQVAAGQQQLFLRPADSYSALGKDVVDAVVALLRRDVPAQLS